jgi:hypothetical protein
MVRLIWSPDKGAHNGQNWKFRVGMLEVLLLLPAQVMYSNVPVLDVETANFYLGSPKKEF